MKKTRRVAFTVLVLFIMQLFSGIGHGDIVKAEENKEFIFITSVKLTDLQNNPLGENIDKSSGVRIRYDFKIPNDNNIKKDDVYTHKVPIQIALEYSFNLDIKDADGKIIAVASFETNGEVKIKFTDYVSTHSNVEGYFQYDAVFDQNNIGNEPIEKIEFKLGAEVEPIVVEVKFKQDPPPETSIRKSGKYDGSGNEITWYIEFNEKNVNVKSAKIIDNIPFGQEYIMGSTMLDGQSIVSGLSYTEADPSDKENSGILIYEFPNDVNEKHIISFKTKISDISILASENKSKDLENKALLDMDGGKKESNIAKVNVKTDYIQKLGKDSTYRDENGKLIGQIDWIIQVNNNNLDLDNFKVEDIIPEGLELISDTFKVDDTSTTTFEYKDNKLSYTFEKKISEQHTITFSTKIKDEDFYKNNEYKSFTNTANVFIGEKLIASDNSNGVGITSNIVRKNGLGYDAKNHYITWQIKVNSNKMEINNPIIQDDIPAGQKYVKDSFEIEGDNADTSGFSYKEADSTDTVKTGTINYEFKKSINTEYTITFKTELTDNKVYASNVSNKEYKNNVVLTADNIPSANSEGTQNVSSEVIKKENIGYDYFTKELAWKIIVNTNKTKLNGVKVIDNITLGQEFLEKSFKIEKIKDGNTKEEVDVDKIGLKYDPDNKDITGTLTYTFNDEINDTYEITFKTKITDDNLFYNNEPITIRNKAEISGGIIPPDVFSEVSKEIENSVISKTADYKEGNDYIDWKISINSNSVPIGDAEIEDILQEGLELDTTSVELFKGVVNSGNGALSKGNQVELNENSVKYEKTTRKFTFKFNNKVDSPYVLTFRTYVTDESKSPFENKAYFKGSNMNGTGNSNKINVKFQGGSSGGVGELGSITLKKVDKETKNSLDEAKFILLDRYKNEIDSGETNKEGALTFNGIRFDIPYYVKEVAPPEGYMLNENSIQEFTIKSGDDSKNITRIFENSIIKANLELLKLDENNMALKGAEFTVYNKTSENEAAKGITDENGIVKFENLVYGNYYYVETKAPKGYVLNSSRHYFTISENGVVLKETVNNEKILGNIKVVKVDEDTNFLANAEITLSDLEGNVVQKALTDENGLVTFTNIPYGDYEVKETKAPEGYNLSKEVLKVSVDQEETGLLYEAGTITNTKIRDNIKINKLDQDANKVVGAEFTLYNSDDEVISTAVTNEDGVALFEDVVYGDYYIKETKTPEGYIGTDEKFDVSIKENNVDKSIEIENTRIKGNLEISKSDGNNNQLKGAEFTVYDLFDKEVQKVETDENGIAKFEDLVYGNYYYIETKAPEGYVLDSTRHDFEIKDNEVVLRETIENERILGNIKVVKIDEYDKFLSNAEITLYDLEGNVVQKAVTDENGLVIFTNVPYGDYKVKESIAPEGYNLSEEILKVSVDSNETGLIYEAGKITDTKIKADIKINKLDQDGNKVVGAEFTLYNNDDEVIGTTVINEDGIALFEDIVYGDYYIKETKTPEGYIGTDKKIEVSVKENNSVYSYEIENTRIKGTVEIKKVDENGNPLKGAEFTLYNKEGKEISKSIIDENGVVRFENLVYGNYYYVETKAPEGYLLKNDKHDFTINENGITLKETIVNERILGNIKAFKIDEDNKFLGNAELTLFDSQGNKVQSLVSNENGEVTFENIPYGDYEVKETKAPEGYNLSEEVLKVSVNSKETGLVYEAGTITNTKIKADIKINKLDQDGNKVIGAEFTLYNSADEVIGTAVTNEEGIALFEDIVYGDYYIKETKTPEGYIGTDEKIEVSVKENNSVYSYEIENTRIKGTVEIKKVDENGNPLKGAEFTLYNKEGKEISKSISDEKGIVRFEAVDYGKYILKETKAPEGYIKDDTEVEVVIDSSKTQVFTFKNVKIKEDANNGNIDNNNSLGKGDLPSTGDVFDVRLFILVGLALILVGSGLLFKKKLKLNK